MQLSTIHHHQQSLVTCGMRHDSTLSPTYTIAGLDICSPRCTYSLYLLLMTLISSFCTTPMLQILSKAKAWSRLDSRPMCPWKYLKTDLYFKIKLLSGIMEYGNAENISFDPLDLLQKKCCELSVKTLFSYLNHQISY